MLKTLTLCSIFRQHIIEEICEIIKEESETLCKIKQSVLQNVYAEHLINFTWTDLIKEWTARAPTLLSFLTAVSCTKQLSETKLANILPLLGQFSFVQGIKKSQQFHTLLLSVVRLWWNQ